jgi:iron complex outermembrane receptor protein/hemoglobin/transferrin/lactoferrin receptor protein
LGGRARILGLIGLSLVPGLAHAAPPEPGRQDTSAPAGEPEGPAVEDSDPDDDADDDDLSDNAGGGNRRRITVPDLRPQPERVDRAASVVTRRQMQERLPRSAPDALRYEPGVYVQQTAHAQASPYVRGLTGQQTVMMFDGIRLNTSTFRQGPNQYFFTVNSRTIQKLEVIRGAASTEYGSDAMGGALLTTPIEPTFGDKWEVHPRAMWTSRTADGELGGRGQIDVSWNDRIGVIGGVGYRDIGMLKTAGPVNNLTDGQPAKSPAFAKDVRTQLGTGFREFTADARVVAKLTPKWKLTAGYYDYRQKDAPRTDKCPPDTGVLTTCLTYLDQFRTLYYLAAQLEDGRDPWKKLRWTVSYQDQHEHRLNFRESSIPDAPEGTGIENHGRDDVHTIGTGLRIETERWRLAPWMQLGVDYGVDSYFDVIDSTAWLILSDLTNPVTDFYPRGQYPDRATYSTSGAWTQVHLKLTDYFAVRGGGRLAIVTVRSPEMRDPDPASPEEEIVADGVSKDWVTGVGNVGLSGYPLPWLSLHANYDQGFRAPNLDDLTSRQIIGAGFQFENTGLEPERAHSLEGGVRIRHPWVEVHAFAFHSWIEDAIVRATRLSENCPAGDPGCGQFQGVFTLDNAEGYSVLYGVDGAVRVFLPRGFGLAATLSYAFGEGPNPNPPAEGMAADYESRIPLSRIPPLNGTGEVGWRHDSGFWVASVVRWALAQDRLAPGDEFDVRIPDGGTPGFVVFDMRAGYRWDPYMLVGLVFENIADSPYRYHGSSVNGAGRSLSVTLELGF